MTIEAKVVILVILETKADNTFLFNQFENSGMLKTMHYSR